MTVLASEAGLQGPQAQPEGLVPILGHWGAMAEFRAFGKASLVAVKREEAGAGPEEHQAMQGRRGGHASVLAGPGPRPRAAAVWKEDTGAS